MASHSRYTKDGASKRLCPFMNRANINDLDGRHPPVFCATDMCMAWIDRGDDIGNCVRLVSG